VEESLLLDLSEVALRGVPGHEHWYSAKLYRDSGSGFREDELVDERDMYSPHFTVTYTFDASVPCRQLSWDHLDSRLCRARLQRVMWSDDAGIRHELDLCQVSSNSAAVEDGVFRFQTGDPMVQLPIAGSVAQVTIEGECWVEGTAASVQGLEALLDLRQEE